MTGSFGFSALLLLTAAAGTKARHTRHRKYPTGPVRAAHRGNASAPESHVNKRRDKFLSLTRFQTAAMDKPTRPITHQMLDANTSCHTSGDVRFVLAHEMIVSITDIL